MAYKIKVDVFEGPFDLLLYLIQKNEIDIYNIPIVEITEQFANYIENGEQINLEHAGEFIEMLAILIRIKTRMLLPVPDIDEDGKIEDPRTELINKLIVYKQHKEAAAELEEMAEKISSYIPRYHFSYVDDVVKDAIEEEGSALDDIHLYDLLKAYKKLLDDMPKITEHHVHKYNFSIEDRSEYIQEKLRTNPHLYFSEIIKDNPIKINAVVSFIALLDLIRLEKITVFQDEIFEDILIESIGNYAKI
jgi:segregation and condensation protein A